VDDDDDDDEEEDDATIARKRAEADEFREEKLTAFLNESGEVYDDISKFVYRSKG